MFPLWSRLISERGVLPYLSSKLYLEQETRVTYTQLKRKVRVWATGLGPTQRTAAEHQDIPASTPWHQHSPTDPCSVPAGHMEVSSLHVDRELGFVDQFLDSASKPLPYSSSSSRPYRLYGFCLFWERTQRQCPVDIRVVLAVFKASEHD